MMSKTDNANPKAKLALRYYFLRKYHGDGADVFDCCQGEGVMWGTLRQSCNVATYWGVDVKPKKGRLKIDSVRVVSQPGWSFNVVDIDTYGSPWRHWLEMLPNVTKPTTVFLTIGQWQMGTDLRILKAVGLGGIRPPSGISCKLHGIALSYLLTACYDFDIMLEEVVEAESSGTARYIGVRLTPQKKAACEEAAEHTLTKSKGDEHESG